MRWDLERVKENVRQAETEDLLDRATVYRAGMEPEALDVIERELWARGVCGEQIEVHALRRGRDVLRLPDGSAAVCSFCRRPAVREAWGWHRLWGLLPVFPRRLRQCREHASFRL